MKEKKLPDKLFKKGIFNKPIDKIKFWECFKLVLEDFKVKQKNFLIKERINIIYIKSKDGEE